jgi:sugar O-acyltransferase (sialic acid O-acetyltransferase NeuD family)
MDLYIYCAGGFGKEIMDVARRRNEVSHQWGDVHFIDDVIVEKERYGARVLKFDEMIQAGLINDAAIVIANGEPKARNILCQKVQEAGGRLDQLVDSSSIITKSARLEAGVVITPLCSVSSDAYLEMNSCVNTMSIIGHDVHIGKNTVISSMVNIGGGCVVGHDSYIGMGALIKEGVKIGSHAIVGMGSVVYQDIPDGVIALGNPARVMRNNTDQKVFK